MTRRGGAPTQLGTDFDPHAEVRQRRASQSRLLLLRQQPDSADHEQPGQLENGEVHLRRTEAAADRAARTGYEHSAQVLLRLRPLWQPLGPNPGRRLWLRRNEQL